MTGLSKLEDAIPALRRYAWSLLRNQSDADDLVQDCLLHALDRMDTHQDQGDMRPWLFTIMHNLHVDRWRRLRRRRHVAIEDAEPDLTVPPGQPASVEIQDMLRGLALLSEEQRQVILLVAVEGLQYGVVAGILGVPVGTVMSRLSRARDNLRAFTEGRDHAVLRRVK